VLFKENLFKERIDFDFGLKEKEKRRFRFNDY
jgi:hypothetical protein